MIYKRRKVYKPDNGFELLTYPLIGITNAMFMYIELGNNNKLYFSTETTYPQNHRMLLLRLRVTPKMFKLYTKMCNTMSTRFSYCVRKRKRYILHQTWVYYLLVTNIYMFVLEKLRIIFFTYRFEFKILMVKWLRIHSRRGPLSVSSTFG